MNELIREFIKDNVDSIKIDEERIVIPKSLTNYFGLDITLKSIINYYQEHFKTVKQPIQVWFLLDKVFYYTFTQNKIIKDCPNGTHLIYYEDDFFPVCEISTLWTQELLKKLKG